MKILILGLREEKTPELENQFPDHEFKVIDIDQKKKQAGKLRPKFYDLVISMSYYVSHQTERTVINNLEGTRFKRVPGSISHLKEVLKTIESKT